MVKVIKHNDGTIQFDSVNLGRTIGLLVKGTKKNPDDWVFMPATGQPFTLYTLKEIVDIGLKILSDEADADRLAYLQKEIERLTNPTKDN